MSESKKRDELSQKFNAIARRRRIESKEKKPVVKEPWLWLIVIGMAAIVIAVFFR